VTRLLALVLTAALGAACTLGPDYVRPSIEAPSTYRDVLAASATATPASLADLQWFDLFKDDTLTALVNTALKQNFDVQIAAERVIQAREQFGIVRSNQFPTVEASVGASDARRSQIGATILPAGVPPTVGSTRVGFNTSWELDVWGRLRRLSESARAQYLATEEARRGIITTLVADVSQTYLSLRALDLQLEISQRTRGLAEDNLRLTNLRRERGVATTLDVRQAEQLLFTATGQIASVERAVAQTENALSLLLGQAPGDVARGQSIEAFKAPPEVPAGLPSALLERRPDIRQAEQQLIAANAQIGVARANFFPRITLTGLLGVESRSLTDILTSRAGTWSIAGAAAQPIFNAGRNKATLRQAESVQRQLVINYQQSIYGALRDVSDALAGYRKTAEQRAEQERLVGALRDATRLSTQRYQGGLDSYLQVLDAERNLFRSELDLAGLRSQELGAIVELYRALGGGWSEPSVQP